MASTTRQEFDADGRLSRLTDAEGFTQTFAYDAFHNVVAVTDALGNVGRRSYDKAGNMVLERVFERTDDGTFRLVLRRSFEYDELNRRFRSRQDRLPASLVATRSSKRTSSALRRAPTASARTRCTTAAGASCG